MILQVSSLDTAGLNLLAGGLSSPRVLLSALQGYTTVKILSSGSQNRDQKPESAMDCLTVD